MNRHELKNLVMRKCVSVLSIAWPQADFHWRNGSLFHSVWARVGRGCFVAGLCVLCIWGVWQTMATAGWIQTHRMQLIHRLQKLAQTKNLHIVQMKFTPLPDEQGFEVGTLDFSLKGSQSATFAYWQSLNQLFQNGIWPKLTWRLLPTGEYALEGQIHLLWDANDAFTDTGVELQDASRVMAEKKSLSLDARALPDHSVAQMRLVGAVQSLTASQQTLFWTLVQSGQHTSAVKPGQYLGIENRLVLSLDAQGLWLGDEFGQPSSLLAWEKVPP